MPEISIIIPSYNHARFLKQRIDSILAQSFQDFEIIFLDDHSRDESKEIIDLYKDYPQVSHIIFNKTNSGSPFSQWEKGILLAKGNWIWIAESDDYAEPDFLETLIANALSYPNIGISYCGSHYVNDTGEKGKEENWHKESFYRKGTDEIHDTVCIVCPIPNVSSALIRKDMALDHIYGLNKYTACGDWIFYTRVLHYSDIIFTDRRLNYFRWYYNSTSNRASSKGIWVSEGIHVVMNIRFEIVKFNYREVYKLYRNWAGLVSKSRFNKLTNLQTLALVSWRLFTKALDGTIRIRHPQVQPVYNK